jgi:hypothetical protein
MTVKFLKPILLLSFLLIFAANSFAQTAKPKPFSSGETLIYEGKFSKIIKGIAVADLTFTVDSVAGKSNYLIKSEAKSKGSLLKLFRFSFLQKIDSVVQVNDFRALKTTKRDVQKERVRDSEAVFDYEEKTVTYVETDPKEPMRPPRKIASEINDKTHDLISGIYSLRLLPLEVGKTFEITVSDSGLVYKVPVRVTKREMQKSILGKNWCFRVEPEIFGTDRLIEKEGSMIIWITDDARRIPVRSQINTDMGRIEVKLKKATGIK